MRHSRYPHYSHYPLWLAYALGTAESVGTLLLPRLVWLGAAAFVALALNPRGPASTDAEPPPFASPSLDARRPRSTAEALKLSAPPPPAARLDGTTEGASP